MGTKQKYGAVIRFNVHNGLRFPLNLTNKPPWLRVVPMAEAQVKVAVNQDYLVHKQLEDHFEADTEVLRDDKESPAIFVPWERAQLSSTEEAGSGSAASSGGNK